MLLYDVISRGAAQHPDRPAIYYRDEVLSYGELEHRVNRAASALRRRGIGPGDSVALLLPNCPQFTIAYYAVTALGGICVPANPLLKPAELVWIWGDAAAKAVVAAPALFDHVREASRSLPALDTIVGVDGLGHVPDGVLSFDDLVAQGEPARIEAPGLDENQPAVTIYTSGTTGRPKGAMLSHRNLTANCRQVSQALEFDLGDNFLCVLPLFHSFAGTVCQNAPLYLGARTTLLEMFHPARVLEAVERHRVTIFPGVPTMFAALLQMPTDRTYDFTSVRMCVSGGAPMPVALIEPFERRFGVPILEGDGPTECAPVTAVNPLMGTRRPGSIGFPIPGVEMRIFDDADREAPVGQVGEIVVRGENVMLGYHNQPQETADAMRCGWYHTGDLGKVDEDGYFYIVDRKKDMVIVGGLNVYPREVEEVLYTHQAVGDAAVIGVPDPLRGEEVVAVVSLKPGASATGRELIRYCRERLANYKVPRRVIFRDSLPRSTTGKVLKRLLRKEMEME